MHWASEWIGLPHEKLGRGPQGFDCLGLFIALHKARFGRVIEDPLCTMQKAVRLRVADGYRDDVIEVVRPDVAEGDALLFLADGRPLHVGFALDGRDMLHTETHASCVECWTGPRWIGKLEGIYRFV